MSGMSVAYIIGNGPSRKSVRREKLGQGVVYGCNLQGREYEPDYLFAVDPWCQYDLVKSGYTGQMCFTEWEPIPIDVAPEMILAGQIPADYQQVTMNPEVRDTAVSWHFYCTGEIHTFPADGFWQRNTAYICYVPATANITHIPRMEAQITMMLAPTGAYALRHACQNGAERIEIYGFDSIAGNFASESKDYRSDQTDTDLSKRFVVYYESIMQEFNDVEFIWQK